MANYISGDYKYKYEPGSGTAAVEVTDKTKSSYEAIQSPITIEGQSYVVTDMSYCFEGCAKMTACPSIPDTVTNLAHCFNGCLNLVRITALPTGVTNMISCFESCSSLVEVPELPQTVTEVHDCFWGCTSLVEAPNIARIAATDISYLFCNCTSLKYFDTELPPNGTNMEACFFGCESLIEAPVIFDQYDNVMYSFYGCTSLKDGLYVVSNPTYYTNIFEETVEDICIIDWCAEDGSIWSDLVSGNIFYERDAAGNLTVYSDYIYNSADNSIHVYNKNKTAYDSFEVIERTFTSLENCFKDCVNLQSVINIPDGITNLKNCFSGCTSVGGAMQVPNDITAANVSGIFDDTVEDIYLWYYGDSTVWHTVADLYTNVHIELPSDGFDEGDYHYTFEDNYTLSCYAIDKTKTTYGAFVTTFAINGHTYTTTDLSNCFDGCASMTSSPVIPSTITDIDECYKNCELLTGNITVSTYSLDSADSVFVGTTKPIFIIRNDSSGSATSWRAIASEYSNVHFETDDVESPKVETIILEIGEGTGNSWYYDSEGHSLRVKVNITVGTNNLPVGYTNDLENGAPVIKIEDVVYTSTNWSKTNNTYTGFVTISDAIKEKNQTVTVEATDLYGNSHSNTAQLESIFVMLDFMPGGKGMAIGRVAKHNGLTIQIPTAIGNGLKPPLIDGEVDLSNFQLIIGNYNKQDETTRDADFIIGGGTNDLARRNSFMVRNGGLYSFNEDNESVMSINTVAEEETDASFTQQSITGNFNTTINNIILPDSSIINYRFDFTDIYKYVLTQDSGAVEGKTYYSKSGDVYTPVEGLEPGDSVSGYYEREDYGNQSDQDEYTYNNLIPLTHNFDLKLNITGESLPITVGSCSTNITSNSIQLNITRQSGIDYYFTIDLYVNYRIINENFISYGFGKGLKENRQLQFLLGQYNIGNPLNILEIGNGTEENSRSNLFTIDSRGDITSIPTSDSDGNAFIINQNNANKDSMFLAKRTDTNVAVGFGVGSGGVNHGIYSFKQGKWLTYGDASNVYIDGINMTSQTANKVLASPNGSTGKPNFRALVGADIPNLDASKITAGTLAGARLPLMLKVVSATSPKFTQAGGKGTSKAVTLSIPSGYELVGIIGFNCSHNQNGSVGGAWKSGASAGTVACTNRTSSSWSDMTVTVYGLCALSNIY